MIIGYDFEVFKFNWLVTFIDVTNHEVVKIWDDSDALRDFYESHKNAIFVGYNSRHYDQYVFKSIMLGMGAWNINKHIIVDKKPGWSYSSEFNKIRLINYDVMLLNHSLKELEGFQGHNIHESSVDFKINRALTAKEKRETEKYCQNDVEETLTILAEKFDDFKSQLWLVNKFEFPLSYMSKTKAQISADILECEKVKRDDEWSLYTLDCIRLRQKNRQLKVKWKKKKGEESKDDRSVGNVFMRPDEWFMNDDYHDYHYYCETEIAGVNHVLAWGGIHGAREKYHYKCDKNHIMLHVDVESFYPRLMIFHNLLTRNAKRPERFRDIFNQRMLLKHAGKKKEQAPYKIVINY